MGILVAYLAGVTFLSPSLLIIYLPYYTAAYLIGRCQEHLTQWISVSVQRVMAYLSGIVFMVMAVALDLVTVTSALMLGIQTIASFLGCWFVIRLVLDWKEEKWKHRLAVLG